MSRDYDDHIARAKVAEPAHADRQSAPATFTQWEGKWRGVSGWRFSAVKPDGKRYPIFEVDQHLSKEEARDLLIQLNGAKEV